jgi:pyrroline-5-carboxylate reductase
MSDNSNLKIGIFGFGTMGNAIYSMLKNEFDVQSIYACDHNSDKLSNLPIANAIMDGTSLIDKVDIIIIAVKPQDFPEFKKCIKSDNLKNKIIFSIMAGVSIEKLQKETSATKIVRTMPNLALTVDRGVIGWMKSGTFSPVEAATIVKIVNKLGFAVEVLNEEMIDKITSISGSGPAYFYFLAKILEEKAIEFGFSKINAERIATDTFLGAAELMKSQNKTPEEMISKIASKKGTTEAALNTMKENEFVQKFKEGIDAAFNRSKGLNKSDE